MKFPSVLIATCLFASLVPAPAAEPSKESERDQQVVAVAKEIQAQQALIAENQTKIDAKLAKIAEVLRLAKIYTSRSGQ